MDTKEKILFINTFGCVTDKRITLNYTSGTEDIPIFKVTSVSYHYVRNYYYAFLGFLVGIFGFFRIFTGIQQLEGPILLFILLFAIIGLLIAASHWIGHHNIIISVGGKNRKPLKVGMSKTKEGREFVDAAKSAVINLQ
jgi:H+/Cl- antiporter ClcA